MITKFVLTVTLGTFLVAGCTTPSSAPMETQSIDIPGQWVFEPKIAIVEAGVPVTWTNNGGAGHTVTIPSLDIDETVKPGETFSYTFTTAGTYDYECTLHPPEMIGQIIVRESAPASSSTNTSE